MRASQAKFIEMLTLFIYLQGDWNWNQVFLLLKMRFKKNNNSF
jgi:uncharacterized protein YutD